MNVAVRHEVKPRSLSIKIFSQKDCCGPDHSWEAKIQQPPPKPPTAA